MPSATLLGQALISGVLAGGMYGLLALGLSLSWGLLRLVNLSHFALAFLAAYLTYELGTTYHVAPWWSAAMIVPVMFLIGLAQHWLFDRFKVNELASLLITFSFAVILEVGDPALLDGRLPPLRDPLLDAVDQGRRRSISRCSSSCFAWWRACWPGAPGCGCARPMSARRCARPPRIADIAAAYGVDHKKLAYLLSGMGAAYAGIAGTFIALIATLAPAQIWA